MDVRAQGKRTVRRLLRSCDLELRRLSFNDGSVAAVLPRLLAEEEASVVLDVGANDGGFADYVRERGYDGRIVSFEPLPGPFAALSRRSAGVPGWEAIQVALSEEPGVASMRRSGAGDTTSSLLPTTDFLVRVLPASAPGEAVEVQVSTVDEQASRLLSETDRPFLKIDTQGSELSVLQGSTVTLERAVGVLVELSFVELYRGQPLFADVVDWLAQKNFVLLALAPAFHNAETGQLLQVDGLFGAVQPPDR